MSKRGFTLIELMIVIGIISLLAVALLPSIIGAKTKAAVTETKARIQHLQAVIESFERGSRRGYYPPDNFIAPAQDFPEKPKIDTVNPGIESLLFFTHVKKLGITLVDDKQSWLDNTDNDDAGVMIEMLQTTKKMEVVDAWGTPFAYFTSANDGYKKPQRIKRKEGDEVQASALKDPKTGAWLNPRTYQIVSAGPDQTFGTEDDVSYPELGQ